MAFFSKRAKARTDMISDQAQRLTHRAQAGLATQEARLMHQLDGLSTRIQSLGKRLRRQTSRRRTVLQAVQPYLYNRKLWIGAAVLATVAGAVGTAGAAVRRRRRLRMPENPDLMALRQDFDYALGELGYSIDEVDAAALLEEAQAALDSGADVEETRARLHQRASEMAHNARTGARRAVGSAQRLVRERPFVVGAAGLALGAVLGGVIKASRSAGAGVNRGTGRLRWRRAA